MTEANIDVSVRQSEACALVATAFDRKFPADIAGARTGNCRVNLLGATELFSAIGDTKRMKPKLVGSVVAVSIFVVLWLLADGRSNAAGVVINALAIKLKAEML